MARLPLVPAAVAAAILMAACSREKPAPTPPATTAAQPPAPPSCPGDNGGLTLSPGFCATVFADEVGHARHLVVAPNGVVYVNTWSGLYFGGDKGPPGGYLVALQDRDGDGKAEVLERFGATSAQGATGGTGIALYDGHVYAEEKDRVIRYALPADGIAPQGKPEVVLSGLPLTGDHFMHPFAIDGQGQLFIDSGSETNACESPNRQPGAKGRSPCPELRLRAGLWRYDAKKLNQKFSAKERYVTGLRNGEGLAFDAQGQLYSTQHGRDQLPESWPKLYTPEAGHELPAEEIVRVEEGADYGWPQCYFDGNKRQLVLAPEYGGDGTEQGVCAQKQGPVAFFPAHWAPNDLLFYQGEAFPAPYRGGAFVAFHGSWNRAPGPQGGYNVVYQPFANGQASGDYVVFADGFAGAEKAPGRAAHRPSGLAQGPDGALYVADDVSGRIWRITWNGGPAPSAIAPAPAPQAAAAAAGAAAELPTPPGATPEQVALGDRIFHGQAAGGTCAGCHGSDGRGTQVGANLADDQWLWGDGSVKTIRATIADGVPKPKQSIAGMPAMGGSPLTPQDVDAVAAYVWALAHAGK